MKVPTKLKLYAPKWYNKLRGIDKLVDFSQLKNSKLDIALPDCCIVGEVWYFGGGYYQDDTYCDECNIYSSYLTTCKNDVMERELENLVNHLESEHPELIKNK